MPRALDQKPLRTRRTFEVKASSKEEAIDIVLNNVRAAWTAEGYSILDLAVVEAEEV